MKGVRDSAKGTAIGRKRRLRRGGCGPGEVPGELVLSSNEEEAEHWEEEEEEGMARWRLGNQVRADFKVTFPDLHFRFTSLPRRARRQPRQACQPRHIRRRGPRPHTAAAAPTPAEPASAAVAIAAARPDAHSDPQSCSSQLSIFGQRSFVAQRGSRSQYQRATVWF